jgi:predicted O-methyltransferase YrrM
MLNALMRAVRYPHKGSALRYLVRQPSMLLSTLRGDAYYARAVSEFVGGPLTRAWRPLLPEDFQKHLRETGEYDGQGWRMMLYLLVRQFRPAVFVETGVSRGASSAFILAAMHENKHGKLYSIDLPPRDASVANERDGKRGHVLSDGQYFDPQGVGDLVPEYLRGRWELILNDAKVALPPLLDRVGDIDVFFHDSLHTYEHMKFEFEAAWPRIRPGGWLISHDVIWNPAWAEITKRAGVKPFVYYSFSMIRKPGGS